MKAVKNVLNSDIIDTIESKTKTISNEGELKSIFNFLNTNLNEDDKQELSNYITAITKTMKGDGAGLSGGFLIDMLICEFFKEKLKNCSELHKGECDIMINEINLSLKKINGKSLLALNWSKNENDTKKENFVYNILLFHTNTTQWWKKSPKKIEENDKTDYTKEIKFGIYIIDKEYCKQHIKLTSNNKSDSIITEQYVYKMLYNSIKNGLFIEIPKPNKELKFSLLNCFVD